MELTHLYDLASPKIQVYKILRDNQLSGESFVADSPKVVNTLLQTDTRFHSILATQQYYDTHYELIAQKKIPKLYVADKKLMQTIVGHKIHHNVMAHGVRPKQKELENLGDRVVMLDYVTSAENVGSIARCAAALGTDSFILPKSAPHPYCRRALRVSMGHISKLKYTIYQDIFATIMELKKRGYKIYGAEVAKGSTQLNRVDIASKWVLLMGNEGYGLSPEVLQLCDEVVTIEMAEGVRSLNVAVAASIMLYTFGQKARG